MVMRWLWAIDRALPPHRLPLQWAFALLLAPLPVICALRREALLLAVITTAWLFCCVGLAVAALLDWSRTRQGNGQRLQRGRSVARLFIVALGATGMAAGVTVMVRAAEAARQTHLPSATLIFGAAFGLMIIAIGAQLAVLPFRKVK